VGKAAAVTTAVRVLLGIVAAGLLALGLVLVGAGGAASAAAIWPLLGGAVIMAALLLERQRYRSEAAERAGEPAGPGGGEPDALPSRFRPTDERFVDPTTNLVMRVFVDPRTGERRYRAES
jgi:hypothetical protein